MLTLAAVTFRKEGLLAPTGSRLKAVETTSKHSSTLDPTDLWPCSYRFHLRSVVYISSWKDKRIGVHSSLTVIICTTI